MMKVNQFSWDTTYRFSEDNAENYFFWGHPRNHKERKLNKNKKVFNWRTHETKTFDVIKLKSQPHSSEIQRLSLSLILIFTRTAKLPFLCISNY